MCVHLSESTFPSDTTPSELFYTGSFSYIEPQMLGGKARMLHLNKDSFSAALDASPLPAVVMFYANWCSKCAMMKPVAEELEAYFQNRILFYEVDVEESPQLADQYAGELVPAFVCFSRGTVVGAMSGIIEEGLLKERIQKIFRNS